MDMAPHFPAFLLLIVLFIDVHVVGGSQDDQCRFVFQDNIVLDVEKSEGNGAKVVDDIHVDNKITCAEKCCSAEGSWCTLAVFHAQAAADEINCFLIKCVPDGSTDDVCVKRHMAHSGFVSAQVTHLPPSSPAPNPSHPITSKSSSAHPVALTTAASDTSVAATTANAKSDNSAVATTKTAGTNPLKTLPPATPNTNLTPSHKSLTLPVESTTMPPSPLTTLGHEKGGKKNPHVPTSPSSHLTPGDIIHTTPPAKHPTTQPPKQPTTQPPKHPTTQPPTQLTTQPPKQPTAQPAKQPTTQSAKQPTTLSAIKSTTSKPTTHISSTATARTTTTKSTTQPKKAKTTTPSAEWISPTEQVANQTSAYNESQPMGTGESGGGPNEHHDETHGHVSKQTVTQTGILIVTLCFGIIFTLVMLVVMGKQWCEGYKRRKYSKVNYLVNGMYS